ncbi:hypothetical protein [Paracoccus sp. DMF]|uniref:hypothetical protein n=1 Tax=Paracoccus sp. DMF TaxID=400837 RepID=UPI0011008365|nr:hypothetical protein [Paracoccus sp. DMF]MCV2448473.1 hypothetical protein [Paracoccus sp. DMF]
MSETLMPTMNLRYIIRLPSDRQHLQQAFNKPGGGTVWIDVPCFVEMDEAFGKINEQPDSQP